MKLSREATRARDARVGRTTVAVLSRKYPSSVRLLAGSAYPYAYATLGESVAWLIGLSLMLEYLFSASLAAITWSGYLTSMLADMGVRMPSAITNAPFTLDAAGHFVLTGVSAAIPVLRFREERIGGEWRSSFRSRLRTPLVPALPILGVISRPALMYSLPKGTDSGRRHSR